MVQVYYCPACQTYHSLFHPSVVPFCSYSYAFLGEIYRFYNECKNFAQTAKKFLLSVKVLHSLIRKIQSDLNLLQRITADFLFAIIGFRLLCLFRVMPFSPETRLSFILLQP